jgi:type IV secretion system protein VirB6
MRWLACQLQSASQLPFCKIALAIIIALGPIFIALSLFEPTRRFFHGWLGQAFNYIVLMGVIIAITTLISDLGTIAIAAAESKADVTIGAVLFAVYLFLGTIFFFRSARHRRGIDRGRRCGVGAFAGTAWGTMASPSDSVASCATAATWSAPLVAAAPSKRRSEASS